MTRRAWLLVVGAYALLALGAVVTLTLISNQTDDIERAQHRLEDLAVNVTASICMQAFADERSESKLVIAFVNDEPQPLAPQTCRRAVERAHEQIDAGDD